MAEVIPFPFQIEQVHVRRFPVFLIHYQNEDFQRHVRRVFSFILEEIAGLIPNIRLYLVCEPEAQTEYDQYYIEIEGVDAGAHLENVRQIAFRLILELVDRRLFEGPKRL